MMHLSIPDSLESLNLRETEFKVKRFKTFSCHAYYNTAMMRQRHIATQFFNIFRR